jgi:hypothetical protein
MKRLGVSLAAAVFVLGISGASDAAPNSSKKGAKARPAKAEAAPPAASAEEIDKLKGEFKWGMNVDEVASKVTERVQASYEERLQKTATDPTKNDRVRKELRTALEKVKKNTVKFDGQKTGYDVSIIDQEFAHNDGESMLVAKEESSTRYFFFKDERLYKMFIAFDKEMLAGKSFEEFGALMQARFGKAKEVPVATKTPPPAGSKPKVDHYEWSSKSGDGLRLVDRSEFYDVYCLVVYDGAVNARVVEARKARNTGEKKADLVDVVTSAQPTTRDSNDNVIDRITGKEVQKLGERRAGDIRVPSPSADPKAAGPDEVNRAAPGDKKPGKGDKKGDRAGGKAGSETKGLEL